MKSYSFMREESALHAEKYFKWKSDHEYGVSDRPDGIPAFSPVH